MTRCEFLQVVADLAVKTRAAQKAYYAYKGDPKVDGKKHALLREAREYEAILDAKLKQLAEFPEPGKDLFAELAAKDAGPDMTAPAPEDGADHPSLPRGDRE